MRTQGMTENQQLNLTGPFTFRTGEDTQLHYFSNFTLSDNTCEDMRLTYEIVFYTQAGDSYSSFPYINFDTSTGHSWIQINVTSNLLSSSAQQTEYYFIITAYDPQPADNFFNFTQNFTLYF